MPEDGREHVEAMRRHLGAGVVAALGDDDVTEIYVNAGDGAVWLDRRSAGRVRTALELAEGQIRSFLNAVASAQRVELTRRHPQIQAELPDDGLFRQARLQGLVPPLAAAPVFVLRKPATRVFGLDEYVRLGILAPAHRAALGRAVEERQNVLVAGGTRSGKTTLVNAVLREIAERCPRDRVVVLEDTRELQCAASDRLALRTTDEVDSVGSAFFPGERCLPWALATLRAARARSRRSASSRSKRCRSSRVRRSRSALPATRRSS